MPTQRNKIWYSHLFCFLHSNSIQDPVCIVHYKFILNYILSNCKTVHRVISLHMTGYIISLMQLTRIKQHLTLYNLILRSSCKISIHVHLKFLWIYLGYLRLFDDLI